MIIEIPEEVYPMQAQKSIIAKTYKKASRKQKVPQLFYSDDEKKQGLCERNAGFSYLKPLQRIHYLQKKTWPGT